MAKILITESVHPIGPELLTAAGHTVVYADRDMDIIRREIVDADAVLVRIIELPGSLLATAKNLKIVSKHGVGYDNIDLDYCKSHGIAVTITPNANSLSVAEHAFTLMLTLAKNIIPVSNEYRTVGFAAKNHAPGIEMTGKTLGLIDKNINWLGDERFALGCIILILLTTSVGQPIVLYVSALGNVDQSIVEAAEVDGATDFQCFWKIKWPAIMPTTLYILVITTINSFQCFALIQLLTSGGPNHKTDTIMYYIYYTAFKQYKYGYGNAMGVVLAVIIAILSAVQFKLGNKDN